MSQRIYPKKETTTTTPFFPIGEDTNHPSRILLDRKTDYEPIYKYNDILFSYSAEGDSSFSANTDRRTDYGPTDKYEAIFFSYSSLDIFHEKK